MGRDFLESRRLFFIITPSSVVGVSRKHLKIDSEVNLAQELGNYGSVGGSADNFFNLDVNARQISLFSLRAAEVNKNTPLGRLQRSV